MSLANSGTSPRTRAAAKKKKKVASSVTAPKPKKGLIAQAQGKPEITRAAVAARSRAAGYRPTAAAIEKTYQRDLLRVQKRLAYSKLATKGEVQKELAAISARSKKKYGKSPTRAQVLATYGRNKSRVQGQTRKELSAIAARSKAKGHSPTAAAVMKTYYNNAQRSYAVKNSVMVKTWQEQLHPRHVKGSVLGGTFKTKGNNRRSSVRAIGRRHALSAIKAKSVGKPVQSFLKG